MRQDAHAPVPAAAELLAHAEFLRALARAILRDEHGAEDVVQDAFVAALEAPPRPTWSLRGWLAGVTRNLALMRVRSETRRKTRERSPVVGAETVSPAEMAERLEAQRRLATEVLALEEPFRTTIVLHYFDSLTPSEIGRRQKVPVKTVYSRLSRGLERLRVRLLAEDRGRTRQALFLIAGGTMAATKKTVLGAAVVLLLAAGGAMVALHEAGAPSSTPTHDTAPSAEQRPGGTPVAGGTGSVAADEVGRLRKENEALRKENEDLRSLLARVERPRTNLPPDIGTVASVQFGDPTGDATTGMLHCRVFDRSGSPQPGVALVFHSNAPAPAERRSGDMKTDADGTASVKDLPPGAYEISLTFPRGGWSRWLKVEAGRTTMATFWVWGRDSGVASGRVTRHGGAPALDAQVFGSPEIQTSPGAHMSYSTKVDGEGRYVLEGLPPGNVRISAFTGLDALKVERTVEVPRGGSVTSDFVLGVPLLTGMVRDDATGEPIEGVEATLNRENRDYFTARTDAEGRFAFLDVPAGTYSLHLSRDGYGGGMLAGVTVETPSKDLEVRLRPAAVLRLRVLTPEGAPFVGRIWVSAVAKDPQPPFRQVDSGPDLTTDAQGRTVCRRIAPGDYELRVYTRMDQATFSKEHEEGQKSVRLVPGDNEVEVQLVRK